MSSLTTQQVNILDLVKDTKENIIVESGPGTGKTFMLEQIDHTVNDENLIPTDEYVVSRIDGEDKPISIVYYAFNKRIVEEAKEPNDDGSPKFSETTEIRTINGGGHGAWAETATGRLTVDKLKTSNIFRIIIGPLSRDKQREAWDDYQIIKSGVDMAKALGYIPDGVRSRKPRLIGPDLFFHRLEEKPSQLAIDLIDEILKLSIKQAYAGAIDYNDQLYMPTLFGGSFKKYPYIILDETQDFSPINIAMLCEYADRGSRIMAVGDTWQSIYAFRGADQESMRKVRERFNCTVADLSVSFRCPSEIVKHQTRNPKLTWSREGGRVTGLNSLHLNDLPDDAVVICRNNAPLFNLALRLLANKRGVSVTGTDIGAKIVNIMNKLGPDNMKQEQVLDKIEEWRADKLAVQSTTASDTADCMRVFASFGKTLSEATGYAEYLFKQRGAITLTTGHKAKGLEWEKVYHLDPHLIRTDKEDQEKNLSYVVTTRSANELYEFETKDIVS